MILAQDTIGFFQAFLLLIIFIPLLLMWGFALVDLFRRKDVSGPATAGWLVVIVIFPFFGALIYLLFRPAKMAESGGSD